MRIGAPLDRLFTSPDEWLETLAAKGHTASYAPVGTDADGETRRKFRNAAKEAKVVIAEVGAWSNPLDPDPEKAKQAFDLCCESLQLAEDLGARCCVNIAGSCSPEQWDGPHKDNFSAETFARIVETTQAIIDAVSPRQTAFALETMPWIFPSTPEQYLDLIQHIKRDAFGVHLDPVNMITSPEFALDTTSFIRHCFNLLGPHIKSCHAKDIQLGSQLTVHLDECAPGEGLMDYPTFFACVRERDADIPIMLEHLDSQEAYAKAFAFLQLQVERL